MIPMKKFIKKLAKKAEGFTLVELVVVIAILGILAGVAVPAYSGYLEKANKAKDEQVVSYANTVMQSAFASEGLTVSDAGVASVAASGTKLTITLASADVCEAMHTFAGKSYTTGAKAIEFDGLSGKLNSKIAEGSTGLVVIND